MRLSQAIKEFLEVKEAKGPRSRRTAGRYLISLRIFCLCMQDPEIEDLDLSHVLWYMGELERLGWKPNGRNLIVLALRKLFEFCNIRGYQVFNEQLIPLPEKQFNIPRVTDIHTFKKLMAQIPTKTGNSHHLRNRALLLMLWDTGARVGEIISLNLSELDLKKRTSLIQTEKSRGRRPVRQIFWTEETNKELKIWLDRLEDLRTESNFADPDAVFVSISKSPRLATRGSRMTDRGVAEVMRMLSNQANLPIVNAHSIRHSMGRDTIQALKSNSAVSNILGHSNLDSSYIYTMLFGDDLKNDWTKVMKTRGNPMQAPKKALNFPALRNQTRSFVRGQMRPVEVKTSKYGRYLRS